MQLAVRVELPPAVIEDELTLRVQTGAATVTPACVTVKICPAMLRVPLRALVLVFAATA